MPAKTSYKSSRHSGLLESGQIRQSRNAPEPCYTLPTTTGTDRGWLGQHRDEGTGLNYLNARYYDPDTAHFITPDPLNNTETPQAANPYTYANNNPTTLTDPTGLAATLYWWRTIKQGDNWNKIRDHYHVTLNQLRAWNGPLNALAIGQRIRVGIRQAGTTTTSKTTPTTKPKTTTPKRATPVIKSAPKPSPTSCATAGSVCKVRDTTLLITGGVASGGQALGTAKIGNHRAYKYSWVETTSRSGKVIANSSIIKASAKRIGIIGAAASGVGGYYTARSAGASVLAAGATGVFAGGAAFGASAGGAYIGAAIGTFILPGVGTAVGGFIGAAAGGWLGGKATNGIIGGLFG